MPTPALKQAVKDGHLTQKQYDKLPQKLLEGIVKSKKSKGGSRKKVAPQKTGTKGHRDRPTKGGAGGRKGGGKK